MRNYMRLKIATMIIILILAIDQLALPANIGNEGEDWFTYDMSYTTNPSIIDASNLVLDAPAGKHGFLTAKNGHFYFEDGTRARFWGTNFSMNASFLEHEEAEKVATNLARMGFNIVRLHHMDWNVEPMGIFDSSSPSKLSAQQLDKVDYLIYQLKQKGIYVDIELHVVRKFTEAEGVVDANSISSGSKLTVMFDDKLIDLQKKYAQDLLTHYNPYTKTKYSEEPAVALVEITNENSIFPGWTSGELFGQIEQDTEGTPLTQHYVSELDAKWNKWLKDKYVRSDELCKAWKAENVEDSENLASDPDTEDALKLGWVMEVHKGVSAKFALDTSDKVSGEGSVKVDIKEVGTETYELQLKQVGIKVEKGKNYTVNFKAKADKEREMVVAFMKETSPWSGYGLRNEVTLNNEWQEYEYVFTANTTTDEDTRLSFGLGKAASKVWLDDVKFYESSKSVLDEGESIEKGNITRTKWKDRFVYSDRRVEDNVEFYYSLEKNYYTQMLSYIHDTLGVRVPVTTTNSYYGQPDLMAQSVGDYMNSHSYWDHPTFPGKLWDKDNFQQTNLSLIRDGTLGVNGETAKNFIGRLSLSAVEGKPFVVSEWNAPFPNQYEYEALALIAAYGSLQDWDGLFIYSYTHGELEKGKKPNYAYDWFDIINNPGKMAQMPTCAIAFIRGDISAGREQLTLNYSKSDILTNYRYNSTRLDYNINGSLPSATVYTSKIRKSDFYLGHTSELQEVMDSGKASKLAQKKTIESDTGQINLNLNESKNEYLTVNTEKFQCINGFVSYKEIALDNAKFNLNTDCSASLTSMDGKNIGNSSKMLLTLVGGQKRQGHDDIVMKQVSGVVEIKLNGNASDYKVYPLDSTGRRQGEKQVKVKGESLVIAVGQDRAAWYEITGK